MIEQEKLSSMFLSRNRLGRTLSEDLEGVKVLVPGILILPEETDTISHKATEYWSEMPLSYLMLPLCNVD